MKKLKFAPSLHRDYWSFAILITIIGIAISTSNIFFSYRDFHKEFKQKQIFIRSSSNILFSTEDSLNYIDKITKFISQQISDKNKNDAETIAQILFNNQDSIDSKAYNIFTWTIFDFVNPQGDVIASSTQGIIKDPVKVLPGERSWMVDAKNEPGKLQFSQVDIGIISGEKILPIGLGITGKDGKFLGITSLGLNIAKLQDKLQRSLTSDLVSFVILDNNYNFITSSKDIKENHDLIAQIAGLENSDLFNSTTNSAEEIAKPIEIQNSKFNFYLKSSSYPLLFLVGFNQEKLNSAFREVFIPKLTQNIYFILFFAILLYLFRIKLINPILRLSSFAADIMSSKEKENYKPDKNSFIEMVNLEQSLIKIKNYKKEIENSNEALNKKTKELEQTKKILKRDLKKLSDSYCLRDSLLERSKDDDVNDAREAIGECLLMLYPEIYSRQLKIVKYFKENTRLNIKYSHFIQVVSGLLSRSFLFSTKNKKILVKTNNLVVNDVNYFCLVIEDSGVGDEEWRRKMLNNDNDFEKMKLLIEGNEGSLTCVDNKENGVRYCVLLPNQVRMNNVVTLFPKKKKR